MAATVAGRRPRRWTRWVAVTLLVFGSLYYLQFGLQALVMHLPQALATLLGAVGMGVAAVRRGRTQRPVAGLVLLTTAPLALLHAGMTVQDPGELIFLLGSLPAPVAAAAVLVARRISQRAVGASVAG